MGIITDAYRFEAKDRDDKKYFGHAITAWTPGELNEDIGWLSDRAKNIYEVARKGDTFDWSFKNGKTKGKMTVSVPISSKYPYAKGKYIEQYVISLFDKKAQNQSTPTYSIVFHHVKVVSAKEMKLVTVGSQDAKVSKYKEVVMSVESGIDYPLTS